MMTRKYTVYLAVPLIYLLLFSCSKRQAEEIVPQTPPAAVTYTNFTQGLVQTRCAGCHGTGKPAAAIWTFDGLASLVNNETRLRRVLLETRTMPRGGSLTAAELKSLQEWFDNKMPN